MKEALEGLYNFSQLLSQNNIKHWLDWGALLHAYRDKTIVVDIDNDVDLGLLKQDWDKVKQLLKDNNIECNEINTECYYMALCGILNNYDGSPGRIDLYFWTSDPKVSDLPETTCPNRVHSEWTYNMLRREIISTPRSAFFCQGVDPNKTNAYLRRTKKYFIQELDKLDVCGYSFPVPRYLERFLAHRYGTRWQGSMTKQEHDKYIDSGLEERHFITEDDITVFVDGVWDLFHQGHVELLKRSRDSYDRVVVGIASDDLVRSYKRDPIIPYDDRVKMLEACKYVDEIYHNAPGLNITEKVLDECGADYALHSVNDSNNWKTELRESARYDQSLIDSGRAHFLSYTSYHSSDIIDKILKDNK